MSAADKVRLVILMTHKVTRVMISELLDLGKNSVEIVFVCVIGSMTSNQLMHLLLPFFHLPCVVSVIEIPDIDVRKDSGDYSLEYFRDLVLTQGDLLLKIVSHL